MIEGLVLETPAARHLLQVPCDFKHFNGDGGDIVDPEINCIH